MREMTPARRIAARAPVMPAPITPSQPTSFHIAAAF